MLLKVLLEKLKIGLYFFSICNIIQLKVVLLRTLTLGEAAFFIFIIARDFFKTNCKGGREEDTGANNAVSN